MIFLRLLPVFISFLLMAAHLVRAGQMVMAFVLLALLLLLLLRKRLGALGYTIYLVARCC